MLNGLTEPWSGRLRHQGVVSCVSYKAAHGRHDLAPAPAPPASGWRLPQTNARGSKRLIKDRRYRRDIHRCVLRRAHTKVRCEQLLEVASSILVSSKSSPASWSAKIQIWHNDAEHEVRMATDHSLCLDALHSRCQHTW